MLAEEPYFECRQKQWDPYENHGGSACAVIGENFVCFGTDTRLAVDYAIDTRYKSRIFQMTNKTVIVATGFEADIDAFITRMRMIIVRYEQEHFKTISTEALAHNIANTLYSKRFFPYYITVLVGGLTVDNKGILFGYDPVGTIETHEYDVTGTAGQMLAPILDAEFGSIHRNSPPFPYPSEDKARDVIRDAMVSAAERDIYTGDCLQIAIINENGLTIEEFPLPSH